MPHCDTPRSRLHRLDVPPSDRIPEGGQVLNALSESCRKWGVLLPLNSLHELNQPTERPPGLGLCLTWTGLRCTQRPRCGGSTCGNSSRPPRVLRRALPSDVFPRRPLAFPRCPLLCLVSGWLALGAAHPVLGPQHPTERQWACGPGWAPRRRAPRTAVALSLTFSWAGRPWAGFLLVSKSREPNPEFVLIFPHFHLSSWRTSVNSVQIQKERTA